MNIYSFGRILERLLHGDVGSTEVAAIVARATASSPDKRYSTVEALATDVAAWRDGLPVSAMGSRRGYIAVKFVRRHRWGVTAATAALVALVVALVLTATAYRRADAARVAEAQRFEQLRSLTGYMLFDLNERLRHVIGNVEARVDLAARAQRHLSRLADHSGADPGLQLEAARGFLALAVT